MNPPDRSRPRISPRLGEILLAVAVIGGFQAIVFRDLVRHPDRLIVDPEKPSVDASVPIPRPVGNDLTGLFLPHHLHVGREVARLGRLPTWDDRGFGGRPLVGNPQASLFYPPVWVAWLTDAPAALGWITVGHLAWLGLGTHWLSRTLGRGVAASLFAGICVSVNPYVLAQAFEGHYPHIWGISWAPWTLGLLWRAWRGERLAPAFASLTLALGFLAGHPQEWYYLNLAIALAAVVATLITPGLGWARWRGLIVAWSLAAGLISVELIPDLMVRAHTLKSDRLGAGQASRYVVGPMNLAQLADPFALGGPSDYRGPGNYWESVLSFGLVPLGLILVVLVTPEARRRERAWVVGLIVMLVFAAGGRLGLFSVCYQFVPWMDHFRVPGRMLFLVAIAGAVLAGAGFDLVRAGRVDGVAVGKVGLPILLLCLATSLVARPTDLECWAWTSLLLVGLALATRRPRSAGVVALILGFAGAVELAEHATQLLALSPPGVFLAPDPIGHPLAGDPRYVVPTRIRADDRLYDDLHATLAGLEKTNVGDSFQIERAAQLYRRLYRLFDPHADDALPARDDLDAATLDRAAAVVLDLMGVGYAIAGDRPPNLNWPVVREGTWGGRPYQILANPRPMPRAYVVPRSVPRSSPTLPLADLLRLDPRASVLMDSDPLPESPTRQPYTPVVLRADAPDRLRMEVDHDAPGLLVVSITWMPGWSATVNGRPVPVSPGNVAQCVLPLAGRGNAEVAMRYDPPGYGAGMALAGASLIACVGLIGVGLRRNRAGL